MGGISVCVCVCGVNTSTLTNTWIPCTLGIFLRALSADTEINIHPIT